MAALVVAELRVFNCLKNSSHVKCGVGIVPFIDEQADAKLLRQQGFEEL